MRLASDVRRRPVTAMGKAADRKAGLPTLAMVSLLEEVGLFNEVFMLL